ncbi:MAG: ATP-dependent DNA helicase RecG [Sphingobacteriales bacterium]|nr:MAG: ATP-dependent DNA helicase RecG [Sphingobacteriales bacterium]
MLIKQFEISDDQKNAILALQEDHFKDLKSKEIKPSKLSKSISGFANAVGGELYIGIDEKLGIDGVNIREWNGFKDQEDANGFIQIFDQLFPLGEYFTYSFLSHHESLGLVLQVSILKTREIVVASDAVPYRRRGAQNLPVNTHDALERLKLDKGIESFESKTINVPVSIITDSLTVFDFLIQVIPSSEPEQWLRKQLLIRDTSPTVAGVMLFADEPQAALPKQSGIKIYRYTTRNEANRDALVGIPVTIEGSAYDLIYRSVDNVINTIEEISILTESGLEKARYPKETLHEIITNAVLHRDYSIAVDIHIRIFDNRIEVVSPGKLPGHITIENILNEQFARNGSMVRIINKFPNPPNKDVGEGLNTAFDAMRKLRLKPPVIREDENAVTVIIKHEPLASPEDIVIDFLEKNNEINNSTARDLTGIQSENSMKEVFKRLQKRDFIEPVPDKKGPASAWRKKNDSSS